jgi:mRNA turnover protein 4
MEPQLRQLGLPTSLQKGVVTLLKDFRICQKGDVLTPEQARILKLFGHQMATFHLTMECMWSKEGAKVKPCPNKRSEPVISKAIYIKPKQKDDSEGVEETSIPEVDDEDGGMETDDEDDS